MSGANLPDDPAFAQLKQRPLTLPVIRAGDRCPVTRGSRDPVPREPYIFCAGCLWFGKGPVYFAWAWNFQVGGRVIDALSADVQDATFSLERVPYESSVYQAKTPWVSKPDYDGPILIRGKRLMERARCVFMTKDRSQLRISNSTRRIEQIQLTGRSGPHT